MLCDYEMKTKLWKDFVFSLGAAYVRFHGDKKVFVS